jgi:catechol-2,3-dioxygenase
MTAPGRPGGVHHVAIQVRDLEQMAAFYTGVLQLSELKRWPGRDRDRAVWLDLGGSAFLALEQMPGGTPAHTADWETEAAGLHVLALGITRDERADWEARLASAGVKVAHRTPYSLYLRDPEGNRIGLSHWPDAEI